MASVRKHGRGWRAYVDRRGVRRSRVFATQAEARDWAARTEYEILHSDRVADATPLADVLDRYAREVSPTKRGHRWEALRLRLMAADRIGRIRMRDLDAAALADWRDRRLQQVAPGSVRREMNLLSAVLTTARREWRLIARNPMSDVRRPAEPPPRTRLPTADEMERIAYVAGSDLYTSQARAWLAFRFACETAMRAGEIVGLTWERVDLERQVAHLPRTKNGSARDVPLSLAAVALLRELPPMEPVFGLSSSSLDALWRKMRDKAGVTGLHFHDSRAYALTQLARRVDVLTLAKISGHRDIRLLSSVYYRETAEDIARRLG